MKKEVRFFNCTMDKKQEYVRICGSITSDVGSDFIQN